MRFLHTMVRVRDIDESLDFYCTKFGLVEMRRKDVPEGISKLIQQGSFKKAYQEAGKCIPLCANCHRIFHWIEREGEKED